ncbi:hypothetical protein DFH09DRAFT_1121306 [Mycena vulgaris]|nr:hypothetical protein DFH09DRAFT_1121306 [Mycena vulgaris]
MDIISLSTRPAKRARANSAAVYASPAVRDPDFYEDSGDCILRVENTLFKISTASSLFETPVFSASFTLPQGNLNVEGLFDDKPIFLCGDKARDLRSFLKCVYAPILETQAANLPVTELPAVVAVAHLAHKYEMASWQKGAFLAIEKFFDDDLAVLGSLDFLAIYTLCSNVAADDVSARTSSLWLDRIRTDLPIAEALDAAESHNDRTFLITLYELFLSQMPTTTPTVFYPASFPLHGIRPVHIQRILAGYWSLSVSWNQFRQLVVPMSRRIECPLDRHKDKCLPAYKSQWAAAIGEAKKLGINDLRGRMNATKNSLQKQALSGRRDGQDLCPFLRSANMIAEPFIKCLVELPQTLGGHFFASEPGKTTTT